MGEHVAARPATMALAAAPSSSHDPSSSSLDPDELCDQAYGHFEYSLLFSAILTVLCSCAQIYLFCSRARFRSHLSRLVLNRTFFDCAFAIITCLNLEILGSTSDMCKGYMGTAIAFLTEVIFIAAEICFLVIAADPLVSIFRPFMDGKVLRRIYAAVIFTVALTYGIVFLAVLGPSDGDTPLTDGSSTAVGLSSYGICWIHNQDTRRKNPKDQRVNTSNIIFIYLPVLVVFVLALVTQLFVWQALRSGLPRTMQSRMRVLRKSTQFVLVYLIYYAMLSTVIYINFKSRTCWDQSSFIFMTLHWLYGGRGAVTLIVWLVLFDARSVLCGLAGSVGDEDEADIQHTSARLNNALRSEILYYTTLGMRFGARTQQRLRDSAVQRSKHFFAMPRRNWHDTAVRPKHQYFTQSSSLDGGLAPSMANESDGEGEDTDICANDGADARCRPKLSFSAGAALGLSNARHTQDMSAEEIAGLEITRLSRGQNPPSAILGEANREGERREIEGDSVKIESSCNSSADHKDGNLIGIPLLHEVAPGSFCLRQGSMHGADTVAKEDHNSGSAIAGRTQPTIPFTDYFPARFEDIRRNVCKIDTADFVKSLRKTTKERFSDGASGAFLYFSEDRRYIIKSMTNEERDTLLSILPAYHAYLKNHRESLLTRFLGCYSVRHNYTGTISFVVMQNIFANSVGKVHETFDLKGSWVGRSGALHKGKTQAECRFCDQWFQINRHERGNMCSVRPNGIHMPKIVKKDSDVDWRFEVGHAEGIKVCSALCADADFLCSQGIMDYSLIVGVERRRVMLADRERRQKKREEKLREKSKSVQQLQHPTAGETKRPQGRRMSTKLLTHYGVPAQLEKMNGADIPDNTYEAAYCTAPGSYTFGVIDILQKFTLAKRAERCWKVYGPKRLSGRGISCVEPDEYCARFKTRVAQALIAPIMGEQKRRSERDLDIKRRQNEMWKEKKSDRKKKNMKKHAMSVPRPDMKENGDLTVSLLEASAGGVDGDGADFSTASRPLSLSEESLELKHKGSAILGVNESSSVWMGMKLPFG